MSKITPCLWFNGRAEEAIDFYTGIFKNSKKLQLSHYDKDMPMPEGDVLVAMFELDGQEIMILNGGPHYKLSPAFSLMVTCEDQAEVDYYWDKLLQGGQADQCAWLTDKFGVSWQIVPKLMFHLMHDPDKTKVARVMQAMMQMVKLDCAKLQAAYDEK
jgi:predicted 3-demethylubiquinone-9 3-methyltransferase (glyoxalase superfamily)